MNRITFSLEASFAIKNEILKHPEVETGGAMLGYKNFSDNVYYITTIIDAGPKAIRKRYNFKCDLDYSNMMIDKLISNSCRKLEYIGEWHSHPEIEPFPSDVDLDSLCNMTLSYKKEVVMVIFGFMDFLIENINNQSVGLIYDQGDKTFYKLPLLFEGFPYE